MRSLRRLLVSEAQRPYVAAHPLALWFSVGVAAVGFLALLVPGTVEQSSVSAVLPDWQRTVFNVVWGVGGLLSAWGIVRGRKAAEGAGMALLAAGLAVYFLVIVVAHGSSATSAAFVVALSIGCGLRARYIARGGPEGVVITSVRG